MPWKLVPPIEGKTLNWYVRGTYLRIRINLSTGTGDERAAKRTFATWKQEVEKGQFRRHQSAKPEGREPVFEGAAIAYMNAGGGDAKHLVPIIRAWAHKLIADIDQIALDTLASEIYPKATAATRNRQVYTPVSAVLKRAGIDKQFKRPRGWKGKKSTSWLEPAQAFALINAAREIDAEFGLLCRFLVYTGMRLGEALSRELRHLDIDRAFIYLEDSKSGEPRGCHLPAHLVEALRHQPARPVTSKDRGERGYFAAGKPLVDEGVPFLRRGSSAKLFRFHDGGALRDLLKRALEVAGLSFPRRQSGFHLFCHTYGSWMHRFGGLDTHGLARTGRWADPNSADRYVHTAAGEEARRADLLPIPPFGLVDNSSTKTDPIENKG